MRGKIYQLKSRPRKFGQHHQKINDEKISIVSNVSISVFTSVQSFFISAFSYHEFAGKIYGQNTS